MTTEITILVPDDAFSALRTNRERFAREMLLAACAKWYELGLVSQSKAAEVAGVSRQEFLSELLKFNVSPFQESIAEIEEILSGE